VTLQTKLPRSASKRSLAQPPPLRHPALRHRRCGNRRRRRRLRPRLVGDETEKQQGMDQNTVQQFPRGVLAKPCTSDKNHLAIHASPPDWPGPNHHAIRKLVDGGLTVCKMVYQTITLDARWCTSGVIYYYGCLRYLMRLSGLLYINKGPTRHRDPEGGP
jgi:hypothetical protein